MLLAAQFKNPLESSWCQKKNSKAGQTSWIGQERLLEENQLQPAISKEVLEHGEFFYFTCMNVECASIYIVHLKIYN